MITLKNALDEWKLIFRVFEKDNTSPTEEEDLANSIITALVEQNRQLREALEAAAKPARREFSGNDSHRLNECRFIINEALAATDPEKVEI